MKNNNAENCINFAYLHFIFLNDKVRTEEVTNVKKMSKKIKTGRGCIRR